MPHISFQCGSAGEITCPESVPPRCVREEIVGFNSVLLVGLVKGIQIAGRCRIQHVDLTPVGLLSEENGNEFTEISVKTIQL